jgi:hypothetical protein
LRISLNRCRRHLNWGLLLGILWLTGCNRGPLVVEVSGTVTHNGQPVPNLMLHFIPDEGRPSWGGTDEAGHYTLHYLPKREGAIIGSHKVFVDLKPLPPGREQTAPPDWPAIRTKYGSRETTPLRVEVKTAGQVLDLQLD